MLYDYQGNEIAEVFNLSGEQETDVYDIFGNLIESESDAVTFVGRWYDKEINNLTYKFTNADGSMILFETSGTNSISVDFGFLNPPSATPQIAVSVDGGSFARQDYTTKSVSLPDAGNHTVCVVADGVNEQNLPHKKWNGDYGWYLKSVSTETGEITPHTVRKKLGIFYGDSITEGIATLAAGNTSVQNSAVNAFPMFCAEELGAIPYYCGYGATGFTKTGTFNNFLTTISYLQNGVYAPIVNADFIVVYHGTNDRELAESDVTQAINALLSLYPNVPIFVMCPFSYQNLASVLQTVCESNVNLHFVPTDGLTLSMYSPPHPNAAGSAVLGQHLADEILDVLGTNFFN